ncbi:MAG TPA: hypothetical protein PK621_10540, partial [Syntrophales bacterium]|nr:hypothetical protein [Syntrophales bacterium]
TERPRRTARFATPSSRPWDGSNATGFTGAGVGNHPALSDRRGRLICTMQKPSIRLKNFFGQGINGKGAAGFRSATGKEVH